MRVIFWFLIFGFFFINAIAQDTRGGHPVTYQKKVEKIAMHGFYFGIDTFARFPSLAYAARDARIIENFFTNNDLYEGKTFNLMINKEAGKEAILLTLQQFLDSKKSKNTDRIIFYFASHAETYRDDTYLISYGTNPKNWSYSGISSGELLNIIAKFIHEGIEVLLIIDTCYSGVFSNYIHLKSPADQKKLIKFLSSNPDEVSYDGVFTPILVQEMEANCFEEKNNVICIGDVTPNVKKQVKLKTNEKQTPIFSSLHDKIYIASKRNNEQDSLSTIDGISSMQSLSFLNKTIEIGDTLLKRGLPSDTFQLINEVEIFMNNLMDDPFTLPGKSKLLETEKKVHQLLKFGLKKFSIYNTLLEDSLTIEGLKLLADSTLLNTQKSISNFEAVIQMNPNNVNGWTQKANALISLKDYEKAIASLDTAVRYNPNYVNLYLAKAWAYSHNKENELAIRNLKIFIDQINELKQLPVFKTSKNINWISSQQKRMIERVNKKNELQLESIFQINNFHPDFNLEIYAEGGKKGLKKDDLKVTEAIYSEIQLDSLTSLYRIKKDGKYGFIDRNGKTIIPSDYSYLSFYYDGLIRAEKQYWGYINLENNIIIPFKFTEADDFIQGYAAVTEIKNGQRVEYYINVEGNCAFNCQTEKEESKKLLKVNEKINRSKEKLMPSNKKIIYVQNDLTSGDGTSWGKAYNNIQKALKVAKAGDQIWVAKGKYVPTKNADRNASFQIPSDVALFGGFAGTESSLEERNHFRNETILSGEIGSTSIEDNSYTIIHTKNVSSRTIIDGFIIQAATANGQGDFGSIQRSGGAWFNDASYGVSSPIIANCTFRDNYAREGAGIYNNGKSGKCEPTISKCTFMFNKADLDGGAIYNNGDAGIASPTITGCKFIKNEAIYGGAIFNQGTYKGESSPTITDCIFSGNTSYLRGGSFYNNVQNGECEPLLRGCTFSENQSLVLKIRK